MQDKQGYSPKEKKLLMYSTDLQCAVHGTASAKNNSSCKMTTILYTAGAPHPPHVRSVCIISQCFKQHLNIGTELYPSTPLTDLSFEVQMTGRNEYY